MRVENWAGLQVQIVGGSDREGGGTGPVVVLLHGFGAPGDDLVGLWRMLRVPQEVRFLFPAAPLSLNLGFGDARAWWMLDMERLATARAQGQWEQLTKEIPRGLQPAHDQIRKFLAEAQKNLNVASQHVVFGGFSQGAMLACDVVLRNPIPLAGLVIMSGSIISKDAWFNAIPGRKGLPVFQSHGTDDPILSVEVAHQLRDAFLAGGLRVAWNEFRGGHEISIPVLEQLANFLRKVLP